MKKKQKKPLNTQKIQQELSRLNQQFSQYYAQKDYQKALDIALKVHQWLPSVIGVISDICSCGIYLGKWQLVQEFGHKGLKIDPNHRNILDALSHASGELKQMDQVKLYGLKSLNLSDQEFNIQPNLCVEPTISTATAGKKIISFSLFGNLPKYCEAAVINAELQPDLYPDWICRFYVDDTVPTAVIDRLKANRAEIIVVEDKYKQWPGTMWRFLALDDQTVSRVIFRDADSIISAREVYLVDEWIKSDQIFHVIRDYYSHTELVLAGLWGAKTGYLPPIEAMITDFVKQGLKSLHFADQYFIREHLWSSIRDNMLHHDSLFGFMNAQAFPQECGQYIKEKHVGANESVSYFRAEVKYPDNTAVIWQLYSSIAPNGVDEVAERLICSYPATVKNNSIEESIIKRYAQGIASGKSKIIVDAINN